MSAGFLILMARLATVELPDRYKQNFYFFKTFPLLTMSRSSASKIRNKEAPNDRKIAKFQAAYHKEASPYPVNSFTPEARSACVNKSYLLNCVKISKVIVIGDLSVGKTTIVKRFCQKIFDANYKATIGVDFEVERLDICGIPFNLQIWDTAGQERFKSIAQSYYRGAHAVIIAFDLTNIKTMINTKTWLSEAQSVLQDTKTYWFLVGTKKDLLSSTAYKNMETSCIKMARKLKCEFWPVSSKTGENINQLFFRIACLTFDDYLQRETENFDKPTIGSYLLPPKNLVKGEEKGISDRNKTCNGSKCKF